MQRVRTSWTNGSKADVFLVEEQSGQWIICKRYRPGFRRAMLQEYLALKCLQGSGVVPVVLGLSLKRRELLLTHIPGQRLLEWVLERYGPSGIGLERFRSFHGLETNPIVAEAFSRFRNAVDADSSRVRHAIRSSYLKIHRRHILHSDPSPRNLIYDGATVHVLDFDHARPSLTPAAIDFVGLTKWYGIENTR